MTDGAGGEAYEAKGPCENMLSYGETVGFGGAGGPDEPVLAQLSARGTGGGAGRGANGDGLDDSPSEMEPKPDARSCA